MCFQSVHGNKQREQAPSVGEGLELRGQECPRHLNPQQCNWILALSEGIRTGGGEAVAKR